MSAVRRNDRRASRNNLASPYARPSKSTNIQSAKKSLWSLSGLINFLNPFGDKGEPEDFDFSGPSDGEIERGSPPRRFSPPQPLLPPPPPPQQSSSNSSRPSAVNGLAASSSQQSSSNHPFTLSASSPASSSSSLVRNLEPVTRFLVEKAGQPLNEFEAAGIVDYIQKNVQGSTFVPDKPEPFRFSVSPSRAASPNQSHGSSGTETPRKTLSRNPNGVYRWQGAGSSRPRNRYQSPGFAPRPQQHRIKLSPPKTPLTSDTKRRRVGDDADSSTPQKPVVPSTSTVSFPSLMPDSPASLSQPSATVANEKPAFPSAMVPAQPVTPRANGIQPRLRTGGLPIKPTTPAIPSPLRQTWKESDSPPQASSPSRPTKAADFMTELLKEVTPTKKPDVSNPYQTASPVKPPAPARKPVAKRPKPNARPAEKPKEQEPEMSAQAIIEATVPKGTKRSRPPPEMGKLPHEEVMETEPFTSAVNGSTPATRLTSNVETITILEVEESPSKRRKTPPAKVPFKAQEPGEASTPKAVIRPAEVIEPMDDTAHANDKSALPPSVTLSPPPATKSILKTSAPKEPSKLRYSFQADKVEVKNGDVTPTKLKLPPREEAAAMVIDELPKYTFSTGTASPCPAGPSFCAARNAVLAMAVTSLPTFEFVPVIAPIRAMNGFNWTAAGVKAPTTSAQTWTCTLCNLQNFADAREKCTVCDAPRPGPTESSLPSSVSTPTLSTTTTTAQLATEVKGFDWSAAGITPPPKPEDGSWTCSVCLLPNLASATEKCIVCDAPR
ncbi:hypothetical protein JVU11DRAFT_6350 [Chiua virens]|nr:hypothetical protein JVU11DRAFT_6350 [Chiua virens]